MHATKKMGGEMPPGEGEMCAPLGNLRLRILGKIHPMQLQMIPRTPNHLIELI